MNLKLTITLLSISIWNFGFAQGPNENAAAKPTIAILGTFHFGGSSSDAASLNVEDMKSEKRSKEILDIVENLIKYKPTKVILEHPIASPVLDSLYESYLEGKHQLSIGESQQLGFRIAKHMQHEHIYPGDFKMDLPFEELMTFMEQEGKMDQFQKMMGDLMGIMGEMQSTYNANNLNDFLIYMNSDKSDNLNKNLYLEYINKMGSETKAFGSEVVATWWHRNFIIMRNIDAIAEPGDRILVIFGQGHTSIFKDFYRTRSDYNFEDITAFLKE